MIEASARGGASGPLEALRAAAHVVAEAGARPRPVVGLAVFRMLFGGLLAVGLSRFLLQGWVEPLFVEPKVFFKFWGFGWVPVWPAWGMYLHYGALLVLALCMATGLFFRIAAPLFTVGFALVQLMDVTNYLNHYVLVVLLCAWLSLSPANAALSLDAKLFPRVRRTTIPAIWLWLFRLQVGVVYCFAAVAKIGPDWLLYGQPMGIWMGARTDMPVLGPILALPYVPLLMSWAGFLYDATIVLWLSWRRSRPFAYLTVLVFHGLTSALFDIGMFPGIMIVATTVFFAPDWPQKLFAQLRWLPKGAPVVERDVERDVSASTRAQPGFVLPAFALPAFALLVLVEIAVPLRLLAYDTGVLWGEQGMRFSWRVMVREKSGSITYRVRNPETGREWHVSPHDYLTWRQANEMSGQPDLILQLAHIIAKDFAARGLGNVEVRVEARVSLNGRKPRLLIDPDVDLTKVSDGLAPASWILPPPPEPPLVSATFGK